MTNLPFILYVTLLAIHSVSAWKLMPITGTFLDVAYDDRMRYTNNVAVSLTCDDWRRKFAEFRAFGIDTVVFQAVHDARWGSYYPSQLSFMSLWNGTCSDVVGTALSAGAELNIRFFLSCEYTHTEYDNTDDPTIMAGRLQIMDELSLLYNLASNPAFAGWYFSSEAYLAPYFSPNFLAYLNNLTTYARMVTPNAQFFVSPYGTRYAQFDDTFVRQLKTLPVDFVAYQDEVGCVRDELPSLTAKQAFRNLSLAHAAAGRPVLWANIESFTWEDWPNNISSPLIPAEPERIAAQLAAATEAGVAKVISFTVQGMYQAPNVINPWGGPNNTDLFDAYQQIVGRAPLTSPRWSVLVESMTGQISSNALTGLVGSYSVSVPAVCPYCHADLVDTLTGEQTPYDSRWSAFAVPTTVKSPSSDSITITIQARDPRSLIFSGIGVSVLQVSPYWYINGKGAQPVARNVSAVLPSSVEFFVDGVSIGVDGLKPWYQTRYDIRRVIYYVPCDGYPGCNAASKITLLLRFPDSVMQGHVVFLDEVVTVPLTVS